jgi:hypothetical protein
VPRIPPLRFLAGLEAQHQNVDGRIEVEWVDDQDRVAAFENRTDGHTMVNASLAWRPFGRRNGTTLLLRPTTSSTSTRGGMPASPRISCRSPGGTSGWA